jgi:hypothetical protein
MENHITDITQTIQLAVAPVFLLTAVATLITVLNIRLGPALIEDVSFRNVWRRWVISSRETHGPSFGYSDAGLG